MKANAEQAYKANFSSKNHQTEKGNSRAKPPVQFVDNRQETQVQKEFKQMADQKQPERAASSLVIDGQAEGTDSFSPFKETINFQDKPPVYQRKVNNTGLPDQLKSGIENLSGISMDDVSVHYNSSDPAQLQAHAFAQGTDIHIGPGQEKHLPHEAWHVVQQKQGRVKPTLQMKGEVNINDDDALETEADVMGAKASQFRVEQSEPSLRENLQRLEGSGLAAQRKVAAGKFNVIGERHDDYDGKNTRFLNGRSDEQKFLKEKFGLNDYWTESEFKGEEKTSEGKSKKADPIIDHVRVQLLGLIGTIKKEHSDALLLDDTVSDKVISAIQRYWQGIHGGFLAFFGPGLVQAGYEHQDKNFPVEPAEKVRLKTLSTLVQQADKKITELIELKNSQKDKWFDFTKRMNKNSQQNTLNEVGVLLHKIDMGMGNTVYDINSTDAQDILVNSSRETAMIGAAERAAQAGYIGAWKIGDSHINNMLKENGPHLGTKGKSFTITTRSEYFGQFDAEIEARAQHEKDKVGGLVLVPGENAKDVTTPHSSDFEGVKSEKNITELSWNGSSYAGK